MLEIPGYTIQRELGHGGMATVYLAVQESLERPVALKVMVPALQADPAFSERFLQEGRTIAKLAHPHVLAVHDIGVAGGHHYIAMEYVSGGDLKSRIRENGKLQEDEALRIASQIAQALGYAHERGFVHRDVKPANILFRESGSAVLTDFGIAKAIAGKTGITQTGTSIGTPFYMSPEQVLEKNLDGRADLYSLGIVLHEMLTGRVPYEGGDNYISIVYAHVHAPVPTLPNEYAHLQPCLDRLLAKDVADRYQSADEVVRALEEAQRGERRKIGAPPRKATGGGGLRWSVGGLFVVGLIAAALYVWQTSRRPEGPPDETPEVAAPTGPESAAPEPEETAPEEPPPSPSRAAGEPSPGKPPPEQVREEEALAAKHLVETRKQEQEEVAELLRLAEADIEAQRLSTPRGSNALQKFRRVLELEPDNAAAKLGLDAIVGRYLVLAQQATEQQQFETAAGYLEKAEAILPEDGRVQEARGRLSSARAARKGKEALSVEPKPAVEAGAKQEMVAIVGGCFQMGSPASEPGRDEDERQHQVCVDDFDLGTHEVTVGQFREFVQATGYRTEAERNVEVSGCWAYDEEIRQWAWTEGRNWSNPGFHQTDQHPVACVSWNDAMDYIHWLNRKTGNTYRLPTEAEWEYAARAGSTTARFWGDPVDAQACRYANIADQAHRWSKGFPCDDGYGWSSPVGRFLPNAFGLYDMLGGVSEWTCSIYLGDYGGAENECVTREEPFARVVRGGAWNFDAHWVRSAGRNWVKPFKRFATRGFRLAR